MITLKSNECESEVTQFGYDKVIMHLDIHRLSCSCGAYELIIHGSYKRKIKNSHGTITIKILRVKCKACGKTHAVFISQIVPFSSVQLNDQIKIIKNEDIEALMTFKNTIDEQHIRRIKDNYVTKFKERLISFSLVINDMIVENCFEWFKCNFMQIKRGINILLCETT